MRYYFKIEGVAARFQLKESRFNERQIIKNQQMIMDVATTLFILAILGYNIGVIADYERFWPPNEDATTAELVEY